MALLKLRPERPSMGAQELLGNSMASAGRLWWPWAPRIDEGLKGASLTRLPMAAFSRASRGARLHRLFEQTDSMGQRAPGVEFGRDQRQGRRLLVPAIGAPTLVSQFCLVAEVGLRTHFLAF